MTEVQQGAANVELVHRALGATIEGVTVDCPFDDKVLVFAREVGVPREGAPVEMHAAALATICEGRICSVEFYARRDEALEAAGEDA